MESKTQLPQAVPAYTCFVILPFSETSHEIDGINKHTNTEEWTSIYELWIKKAVENYSKATISCERSATAPGNFVKGIVGSLNDSNFVIADLTGNKANVYYELGIRHALRNGTIIITQHKAALPSDLGTYYCLEYSYTSAHYEYANKFAGFQNQIHSLIETIVEREFSADSPVSDFLGFAHYSNKKQHLKQKADATNQLGGCLENLKSSLLHMNQLHAQIGRVNKYLIPDSFPLDMMIMKFSQNQWELLDQSLIEEATTRLLRFRTVYRALLELCRDSGRNGENRSADVDLSLRLINEADDYKANIESVIIRLTDPTLSQPSEKGASTSSP